MHNSFLACVLIYHNLQPENTYFYFFQSEIIWPKIPLLPQKRNSLVKGWVVCVFVISRFPFITQLHQLEEPCLLPDAWSHSLLGNQVSTSWLDSASAQLWPLIHSFCRKPCKACAEWRDVVVPKAGVSVNSGRHSAESWSLCKGALKSWFLAREPSWCK